VNVGRDPDPLGRKALRAALRAWKNSPLLGELPLARLAAVERRRRDAGYSDSNVGYGLALRDVLREAIESLKPEGADPDPLERRWRAYTILSQQYLDGRSPDYVAVQMGVARSTYDHEQAAALDTLADLLREQEARVAAEPRTEAAVLGEGDIVQRAIFLAPPTPDHPIIGREALLDELKRTLQAEEGSPSVVLHGLPGVGKTTLAVTLANDPDILSRYDGGVLWVGLGRTPDLVSLMALWMSPLGLSPEEADRHATLEARAKLIHAAIGMRRVLIVVDDVWKATDGLAFMIGGPNSAHVFTSRMPAVAFDLASHGVFQVQELDRASGVEVLRGFAPNIVESGKEEVAGLVDLVGGLPLALVLMGRHLGHAARRATHRGLSDAIDSLNQARVRLDLSRPQSPLDVQPSLGAEQPHTLDRIIRLSLEELSAEGARAIRSLAVIPAKPNTFSESAAFEVGAMSAATLDELTDSGLLERDARGRYTIHQVISEVVLQGPESDEGALDRLVTHYVRLVEVHSDDLNLLDQDLRNIIAALDSAEKRGMDAELIGGAIAVMPYLEERGLYDVASSILGRAEAAARQRQDEARLAGVLSGLGRIAQRRGEYERAGSHIDEALHLVENDSASPLRAELFQAGGVTAYSRGDYPAAESSYRRAIEAGRSLGQDGQVAAALANLGTLSLSRGDPAQAEAHFNEGLALARKRGDMRRAEALLMNLGVIAAMGGEQDSAEVRFQESLELARSRGSRPAMCTALTNLGTLASEKGDGASAELSFIEALELAREVGDRARLCQLLANLGAVETSRGVFAEAEAHLNEGVSVARDIGHKENLTLLLNNLGVLERDQGRSAQADAAFREALELATALGHVRYRCVVLGNWGALHLGIGNLDAAVEAYETTFDLACGAGLVQSAAEASFGLAQVAHARGDLERARKLASESLAEYESLGHRRSAEVAEWLEGLR
jgi:tetratricopeptide (TPR) repeat protein